MWKIDYNSIEHEKTKKRVGLIYNLESQERVGLLYFFVKKKVVSVNPVTIPFQHFLINPKT